MRRAFAQMATTVYLAVAIALTQTPASALDSDTQTQIVPRETRPLSGYSAFGSKPALLESVPLWVESRPADGLNLIGSDDGTAGLIVGDTYTRRSDKETGKSGVKVVRDDVLQAVDGSFVPDDVVDTMGRKLDHETQPVDSMLSGSTDAVRRGVESVVLDVERGTDASDLTVKTVTDAAKTVGLAANLAGNTTTGMPVNRTAADSAVENEMYNASKAGKTGIPQLEVRVDDAGSLTEETVGDVISPVLNASNPVKDVVANASDLNRKTESTLLLDEVAHVVNGTDVRGVTANNTLLNVVKPVVGAMNVSTNSSDPNDRVVDVVTNTTEHKKLVLDPASGSIKPVASAAGTVANASDLNMSLTIGAAATTAGGRTEDLRRSEMAKTTESRVKSPVVNWITNSSDFRPRTLDDTSFNITESMAPVVSMPAGTAGFTVKTAASDVNTEARTIAEAAAPTTSTATKTSSALLIVPTAFTSTSEKDAATHDVRDRTSESTVSRFPKPVMPSETGASATIMEQIPSLNEEVKVKPTTSHLTSPTVMQLSDLKTGTSSGENDSDLSKSSTKREQKSIADDNVDNNEFGSEDFDDDALNRKSFSSSSSSVADMANVIKTPSVTGATSASEPTESDDSFAPTFAAIDGSIGLSTNKFNTADASSLIADLASMSASTEGSGVIDIPTQEPTKTAAGSASLSAWMEIPSVIEMPTSEHEKTALRLDPPAALGPSPVAAPVAAVAPQAPTPSGSSTTESQEALSKRAKDVSGENGAGTSALFVVVGGLGCVAISAIVVYVKKQSHEIGTVDSGSERASISAAAGARSSEGSVYNDPLGTRYSSIVMITPNGDGVCIL
uniref:Uncharacterized protein n=1 Tax=Peronospora matthiolae TaxID=2874970 RepID=A0AAV1TRI1_9STRA